MRMQSRVIRSLLLCSTILSLAACGTFLPAVPKTTAQAIYEVGAAYNSAEVAATAWAQIKCPDLSKCSDPTVLKVQQADSIGYAIVVQAEAYASTAPATTDLSSTLTTAQSALESFQQLLTASGVKVQ